MPRNNKGQPNASGGNTRSGQQPQKEHPKKREEAEKQAAEASKQAKTAPESKEQPSADVSSAAIELREHPAGI